MTAEEIRDLSVLIVGDLVINGLVKDCTDTDDEIEFEFQDAIAETLHKKFNFNKIKNYIVGKSYRYSEIPEEDTEEFTVSNYGLDYLGQNAIHLRYHKTETDIWFIWNRQANEGVFKCVYNS